MKNIVVCVDLKQNSLDTLKKHFMNDDSLNFHNVKFHFVHIFEIYNFHAEIVPVIFPTEEEFPELKKRAITTLEKLAHDIGLKSDQVILKCFLEHSREEKINSYLNKVKADMVVVASRGKHGIEGFFLSSFADFLCNYSPCDVLIIRPNKS